MSMLFLPEAGGENSADTAFLLARISSFVDHVVRLITLIGFLVGVVLIADKNPGNIAIILVKWSILIPAILAYQFFLVQHVSRVFVEVTTIQSRKPKIAVLIVRLTLSGYLLAMVWFGLDLLEYVSQIKLFQ